MGELEVSVAQSGSCVAVQPAAAARSSIVCALAVKHAMTSADAAMVLMSPPGWTIPACVVAVAWLPEPVNCRIWQRPVQPHAWTAAARAFSAGVRSSATVVKPDNDSGHTTKEPLGLPASPVIPHR